MNIYPKTCRDFIGLDKLIHYVEKDNGIELQFFNENGIMNSFEFKSVIENLIKRVPNIKEITIHPPLTHYDIENVIARDVNIIRTHLNTMVELSRKYEVKLNIIYHTMIDFESHKILTLDKIAELLKIIDGENVTILLENIFMFFEKKCTVYEIAKYFDHPNLKVCFDICHLHCRANIYREDVVEHAAKYLDPILCGKYTYQVHFASTLNDDGYINQKTHGRRHLNLEDLRKDMELLESYNMTNCNFITEVSEDDYSTRADQIEEIKMLERLTEK